MSIRSGRYGGSIARVEVTFCAGDARCAAWFYPQPASGSAPVVVLAHGFGLVREGRRAAGDRGGGEQVPYSGLGGRSGPPRIAFLARRLLAAVYDELRGRLGRTPATIPLVAEPASAGRAPWRRRGTFAAFQAPGAPALLRGLLPNPTTWVNAYTPRVALRMPRYRPFDDAARIGCPWLVLIADHDDVTPPEQAARLARAAPRLELHRLGTGHFEVYTGDWFEHAVDIQSEFLQRHLLKCTTPPTERE